MATHKFRYVGDEERTYPGVLAAGEDGPVTLVARPGETYEVEGLALDDDAHFERADQSAKAKQKPSEEK